ncbi:MAG TPA: VanZ family protein [Rhodocyclaceae bacterium]|nr:VanZ family protein [Rhodocyclaceae bacterium]
MPYRPNSPLTFQLSVAYAALVIYASLYPFTDWRDLGTPLFVFLTAAWPRYWTVFDLATNVLAYLPLGFLWATLLQSAQRRWPGVVSAILIGGVLSLILETIQNYLPSRVPSNLDLACNTLGAAIGALLGAVYGKTLLNGGRLHTLRTRWVLPGAAGDSGLTLMALWLLTQLNPETLLFGNGDLRQLLDLEPAMEFDTLRFSRIESAIAFANTLAVGLMASCLLRRRHLAGVALLLLAGLAIHAFAAALLVEPRAALRWITPGNRAGFLWGVLTLLLCLRLIPSMRRVIAGSALLFAAVLVNLAPPNPYLTEAAQAWWQGHFLNFNGLTRLSSMLWPFLALPWLLMPQRDPSWNPTKT